MGNQLSTTEEELLTWGCEWWREWKLRMHGNVDGPESVPRFTLSNVSLNDKDEQHIHTASFHSNNNEGTPLVCVHGYAGGVGSFYNSLPPLVEQWGGHVYAVHLLS